MPADATAAETSAIGHEMAIAVLIFGVVLVFALLLLWLFGERWRPMRRSTWRLMREGGIRRVCNGDFFHAYVYGRWSNQYIGYAINRLFPRLNPSPHDRRWADKYHGKVLTPEQAAAIVTLKQTIPLQDLEQVIPYATARSIVLSGPPDIVVYECPCRSARPDPCRPTLVCMVIGQPFADFIREHNPASSRSIDREEALALLRSEHERGHIHAAYFKDVMLDRFFAICNCCRCCCGGIEAMEKHGVPMLSASGYAVRVDVTRCESCGACASVCPFSAMRMNGKAYVSLDACMGCGVCTSRCPNGALALERDERKGIPLDVRLLS
jgi:ferredoxin